MGTQVTRKNLPQQDTRELVDFLHAVKGRFGDETSQRRQRVVPAGPAAPAGSAPTGPGAVPAALAPAPVAPAGTASPAGTRRILVPTIAAGASCAAGTAAASSMAAQVVPLHDGGTRRWTQDQPLAIPLPACPTTRTRLAPPPRYARGVVWAAIAGIALPIAAGFLVLPHFLGGSQLDLEVSPEAVQAELARQAELEQQRLAATEPGATTEVAATSQVSGESPLPMGGVAQVASDASGGYGAVPALEPVSLGAPAQAADGNMLLPGREGAGRSGWYESNSVRIYVAPRAPAARGGALPPAVPSALPAGAPSGATAGVASPGDLPNPGAM
ncbi:MAG: hypothetical protein HYZ53_00425 [Planctomycetes bacterium]|nr:hypothetical protein [Planctomycetota bacterium]